MLEAIDRLRDKGINADYMRIGRSRSGRGRGFLDAHAMIFVVEQNRDAQLRTLLPRETGFARGCMTSVLDYGGMPLTAHRVIAGVKAKLERAA